MKWAKKLYQRSVENRPYHIKSKYDPFIEQNISSSLFINRKRLELIFNKCEDTVIRELTINLSQPIEALIIYAIGLVEKKEVNENILRPLMYQYYQDMPKSEECQSTADIYDLIKLNIVTVGDIKEAQTYADIRDEIFIGNTVLIINGVNKAMSIACKGWKQRSVEEPESEVSIRGSHEGFTENLRTNSALIRRRIKSHNLKFEALKLGRYSQTAICIGYIKDIADDQIVDKIKQRLSKIDIDGVLESGYVEQFISDSCISIFPTIGNTEKPDIVASKLLEGRVAILTDGTPSVLTVPFMFTEYFQSSGDYYSSFWIASSFRIIRWIAFFLAIGLPGLFVAAQNFHYEMIPTRLVFTVATSHEGIPFSATIETLLMSTFFVILREAGVRMPRSIGTATSIVGALVLGDAAISAGLVGAPAVMVTAISGLSTFVVPQLAGPITVMRIMFIFLGGFIGIYGLSIGLMLLMFHMSSLHSFGVYYLTPIAPFNLRDQRDNIFKAPIWADLERPQGFAEDNKQRQSPESALKPLRDKKTDKK